MSLDMTALNTLPEYDLPLFVRGDTLASWRLRFTEPLMGDQDEAAGADGVELVPLAIIAAALEIRTALGASVHRWESPANLTIEGDGWIRMHRVLETQGWETGEHNYDCQLTLASGETYTMLAGRLNVLGDITHG